MSNAHTKFDEPSWFRDWFIGVFRVWPKLFWNKVQDTKFSRFDIHFDVVGMYGISIGPTFLGYMKMRVHSKKTDPNLIYPGKDDTNVFPEEDA